MATTTQKSGLTFKHKVGYAMGDLGGCMTFALMSPGHLLLILWFV